MNKSFSFRKVWHKLSCSRIYELGDSSDRRDVGMMKTIIIIKEIVIKPNKTTPSIYYAHNNRLFCIDTI